MADLDEWKFQSDLPTLKSSYFITDSSRQGICIYCSEKILTINILVKPMPDEGKVYFEMNNIPALRIEPYMDAQGIIYKK